MGTRTPGKRKQIDPIEKAIEAALFPGHFISCNAAWSFMEDVQYVADRHIFEEDQCRNRIA